MMMSERPSGGGAAAGVSIGNYKGVMLCNRPFAGVAAAAHKAVNHGSGGNVPFRSAVIPHEPIGLNPSRERRAMVRQNKKKKNSALSRHKKWLRQLQKAKEEFQSQASAEEVAQQERRKKFASQQAALRAEVRNTLEDAVDEADRMDLAGTKFADEEEQTNFEIAREMERLNRQEDEGKVQEGKVQEMPRKAKQSTASIRSKPAWALTEAEQNVLEDEEADELMDFAQNLDVDKYLDDLEVRAALESVRQRIREIDVKEDQEENQRKELYESKYEENENNGNSDENAPKKLNLPKARLTKDALKALDGDGVGAGDDDARSVASHASARSVLSNVKSLRGIHSARSLAQLAKQIKQKESGMAPIPEFIPPRISIVDDKKGIREEIKNQPSQLPYIHRNPAV